MKGGRRMTVDSALSYLRDTVGSVTEVINHCLGRRPVGQRSPFPVLGDGMELRGERRGSIRLQRGLQHPILHRREGAYLPVALHNQPQRHRLHAPGGEPPLDLPPEQGAELVAHQPVEDAPGLLGVHQPHVDVAGVVEGLTDCLRGDLVEDNAVDWKAPPAGRPPSDARR